MKDDPELQMNHDWSDDDTYSPKRSRIRSDKSKSLQILLGILLIFIFVGGILYFLIKRPIGGEASLLQSKLTVLEQKITELEKQLLVLQEKINTLGRDPALLQRVDALFQKVEALEKQQTAELKTKPSAPAKSAISTGKQYHTVQKGETLYRISKKYRISVGELRKLNKLSADQPLLTGQKLLVSPGR
jgi:LysM repeat protein